MSYREPRRMARRSVEAMRISADHEATPIFRILDFESIPAQRRCILVPLTHFQPDCYCHACVVANRHSRSLQGSRSGYANTRRIQISAIRGTLGHAHSRADKTTIPSRRADHVMVSHPLRVRMPWVRIPACPFYGALLEGQN